MYNFNKKINSINAGMVGFDTGLAFESFFVANDPHAGTFALIVAISIFIFSKLQKVES